MSRSQNRIKLTKSYIENLTPGPSEYSIWDTKCDGLHVRVQPSGSKVYSVYYRQPSGKQRRRSLGKISIVSLDQARKKAQQVLADAARGCDQYDALAASQAIPLLSEIWPGYLEDHAKPKKSETSLREDRRLWARHIEPVFGLTRISEITEHEVRRWHAKKLKTPYEANRALALMSVLFTFSRQFVDRNPCQSVQRFPEEGRQVLLSQSDFGKIVAALEVDHDVGAVLLIKLLMWTGARRGEALKAEWGEFDLEEGIWSVPLEHIKGGVRNKKVLSHALPEACVRALLHWKKVAPNKKGLVFPSPKDSSRSRYDVSAIWKRVRKRSGLMYVRIHDLRHHFATVAVRSGVSLEQVKDALGHSDIRTTLRYAHFGDDSRHEVSKRVAEAIDLE